MVIQRAECWWGAGSVNVRVNAHPSPKVQAAIPTAAVPTTAVPTAAIPTTTVPTTASKPHQTQL